jgi:integrase
MTQQTNDIQLAMTEMSILSFGELEQILAMANADPKLHDLRDVVTITGETAVRPGEMAEIHWSAVDIANSRFFVSRDPDGCGGRIVPFGSRTSLALVALFKRRPDSNFILGDSPSKLLRRVSAQLRMVAGELGSRNLSFHTLRRAVVSHWLYAGMDTGMAKRILGLRDVMR